jgi:UPF0755 protein
MKSYTNPRLSRSREETERRLKEARDRRVRPGSASPSTPLWRSLLRLFLLLLVVGTVIVAGGLAWGRLTLRPGVVGSGSTSFTLPTGNLEAQLLGLYVSVRGSDVNNPAGASDEPVPFTVRLGDTATTIGDRLRQVGLVRDAEMFRLYVRYQGLDGRLEAGEYTLRASMTLSEIVTALQHSRAAAFTVTVREGLRTEEVAELLAAAGVVNGAQFLTVVKSGRFDYPALKDRPAGAGLEGYLFPDTYEIAATATATQVVDLLLGTFEQRFSPAMRQQAADRRQTIFQVQTVASLVEREAQLASERPVIAGVYLNRLAKGMALEADSTVQYALGYDAKSRSWWKPLALDDLRKDVGPYSTYLSLGLPPGPICSPGLAATQAVLQPAKTDYLYYYAKGDGSHAFARTFEEHQDNMRKYGR